MTLINTIRKDKRRIVLLLFILDISIKAIFLTHSGIDLDEPFSIYHASGSLQDLKSIFSWEFNPPLFFIILHFWIKIFGSSLFALRLLPLLFSGLTIIFIFKIGIRYANTFVAIGSVLLISLSNLTITESHDIRSYTFLMFLASASFYYFFRLIELETRNVFYTTMVSLFNLMLVYTHFISFFILLLQIFYALFLKKRNKVFFKQYIISTIIVILGFAYYLPYFINRFSSAVRKGIYTSQTEMSDLFTTFKMAFANDLFSAVLFLVILGVFAFRYYSDRDSIYLSVYQRMIIGWFGGLYITISLVSLFFVSILPAPKYIIFLLPGFFLTLLISINYMFRENQKIKYLLFMGVFLFMIINVNLKSSHGLQAKEAINLIKEEQDKNTVVFVVPKYMDLVFSYHFNRNTFHKHRDIDRNLQKENVYLTSKIEDLDTSTFINAETALLFDGWNNMAITDPDYKIINRLKKEFDIMDTLAINSMTYNSKRSDSTFSFFKGYSVFRFRRFYTSNY